MRSVTILGATGSVGRSTLDLIERDRERFEIVALTARRDIGGLIELATRFRPQRAVIGDEAHLERLRDALAGTGVEAVGGEEAIVEAAGLGADWTMAAIVGTAGLRPVMRGLGERAYRRARQQGGARLGGRADDRGGPPPRRDAAARRFRA